MEMDRFRQLCIDFIDEYTGFIENFRSSTDCYNPREIISWSEAVTNHIAIYLRDIDKKYKEELANSFSYLLGLMD